MPCERLPALHQLLLEHPERHQDPEWARHLGQCAECRQEVRDWNRSLEVYLQVGLRGIPQMEIQIWDRLQTRLSVPVRPPLWKSSRLWAIAASLAFVMGMASWWQQRSALAPQAPPASAAYRVIPIVPGQTFGPSFAETEVIWNETHFGLSIRDNDRQFPMISIGVDLDRQTAQAATTSRPGNYAYHAPSQR